MISLKQRKTNLVLCISYLPQLSVNLITGQNGKHVICRGPNQMKIREIRKDLWNLILLKKIQGLVREFGYFTLNLESGKYF